MKKKNPNQLSIFDIMINHNAEPVVPVNDSPIIKTAPTIIQNTDNKNLCPYKIPTIDEIIKRIKSATYRVDTSQLIADVFECGAISIANTVSLPQDQEREERYKQIMEKYEPAERQLLCEIFGMIFALLSSVVYDNGVFNDYLGDLFMRCNQGNGNKGQFFTPYHISQFMAKTIIGDEVKTKAENDGILTISDPCCGGGGLILAALDVLKNDYDINYARNCFVECTDIDIRCVHMTYLQLSLAGVPTIIKHQNALSRELWSVWKTPAFVFQYTRFCHYENYN